MSTFYGGDQLVRVIELYAEDNTVEHTIPSGRYAVVEFSGIKGGTAFVRSFSVEARTSSNDVYFDKQVSNTTGGEAQGFIYSGSGHIIKLFSNDPVAKVFAIVKEYAKP